MTAIANARQIHLERCPPAYWRVTFDLPPLNIFGPKEIPQLIRPVGEKQQSLWPSPIFRGGPPHEPPVYGQALGMSLQ